MGKNTKCFNPSPKWSYHESLDLFATKDLQKWKNTGFFLLPEKKESVVFIPRFKKTLQDPPWNKARRKSTLPETNIAPENRSFQ